MPELLSITWLDARHCERRCRATGLAGRCAFPTRPKQGRAGRVGRLITRPWLYSVVLLLLASSRVAAACVDPSALVQSTASITRDFSEEEQKADPSVLGISGTGWFLSPGSMATVAHVAEAMHLSGTDWKQIEIWDGQGTQSVSCSHSAYCGLPAREDSRAQSEEPISPCTGPSDQDGAARGRRARDERRVSQ